MIYLVSMWGISMASQIDWTWLDVVPDWGPKSAATPERRRDDVNKFTIIVTELLWLAVASRMTSLNQSKSFILAQHFYTNLIFLTSTSGSWSFNTPTLPSGFYLWSARYACCTIVVLLTTVLNLD